MSPGRPANAVALVPIASALGVAAVRRGRVTSAPHLAGEAGCAFDPAALLGRRGEAAEILLPLPSHQYLLRSSDVPAAVAARHVLRAGQLQVQGSLTIPAEAFAFDAAQIGHRSARAAPRFARRVFVCAARRSGLTPPAQLRLDQWPGRIRWVPDALVLWQALSEHLSGDHAATLVLHCTPPENPQLLLFEGAMLQRHSTLPGSTLHAPVALATAIERAAAEMPGPVRLLLCTTMPEADRQALGQALHGIDMECVGPTDPAAHADWLACALAAATDRRAWRPPPIAFTTTRRTPQRGAAPGTLAALCGLAAASWVAALVLAGIGAGAQRKTRNAEQQLAETARATLDLTSLPRGAELATIRNVALEELAARRPLFAAAAPSLIELLQVAHATSVSLASVEWRGFEYTAPSLTIKATGPDAEIARWTHVLQLAWRLARVTARPTSARAEWILEITFAPSPPAP